MSSKRRDRISHGHGVRGSIEWSNVMAVTPDSKSRLSESKRRAPARARARRLALCRNCGEVRPGYGRGLCGKCYKRHAKAGTLEQFAKVVPNRRCTYKVKEVERVDLNGGQEMAPPGHGALSMLSRKTFDRLTKRTRVPIHGDDA